MNAGQLRQRITLQVFTEARNAYSEAEKAWHDEVTVWADVQPLRGKEYEAIGGTQQSLSHRIHIRWRPGMTPDYRIKFVDRQNQTRYFDIESIVDPSERGIMLELMCREQVNR